MLVFHSILHYLFTYQTSKQLIRANIKHYKLIRLTHADNPCPRLGPFSTGWKLMNVFKLEEFQSQKPFFTTKTDEFQGTVFPCVCVYVCMCVYISVYVCMYVCMYVFVCVCMFVHLMTSQSVCTSFCLNASLYIRSGCYEYTALFCH